MSPPYVAMTCCVIVCAKCTTAGMADSSGEIGAGDSSNPVRFFRGITRRKFSAKWRVIFRGITRRKCSAKWRVIFRGKSRLIAIRNRAGIS